MMKALFFACAWMAYAIFSALTGHDESARMSLVVTQIWIAAGIIMEDRRG